MILENTTTHIDTSQTIEDPKNSDPREYFRITHFQKEAAGIDLVKEHPWSAATNDGTLINDKYGQIAMAQTFDAEELDEERKVGLLLAEKDTQGNASSIYIRNELSSQVRGQLIDIVNDVAPRLSGETRHRFMRALLQLTPALKNQPVEIVSDLLTTLALSVLPDHSQGVVVSEFPQFGFASPTQQEQLTRLMKLVSKKISLEVFTQKLIAFQDSLRWTDGAFGSNYPYLLMDVYKWAFNNRQDTTRNTEALRRKELLPYTVQEKITRKLGSKTELQHILNSLPVEPKPDDKNAIHGREEAQMVQLDKVVGGTGITSWTVSTSEGRGLDKIFELAKGMEDGTIDVMGNNKPIKAIEVDGKYFIDSDGRHRTAALKALGVKEVPMLVSHVKM